MTPTYRAPRLLQRSDVLDQFQCRSQEQTEWLAHHARQANAIGTAKVLVVTEVGKLDVVAYYAWRMASIDVADAPLRVRQGAGRYPQPAALLARLAVDRNHEGRGIGAAMLADVIIRAHDLAAAIGCRGLLLHAQDDAAREFCLHLVPEFEASPTDANHLVLLAKDIDATLRAAASDT